MNILIIGSGAREHAIVKALFQSEQKPSLYCYGIPHNPGIEKLTKSPIEVGDSTDTEAITKFAQDNKIDFAVIGPEAPLEAGVADALFEAGIFCIGPFQARALLETSKSYTRDLLTREGIEGCPKYQIFSSMEGVEEYIRIVLQGNYVIKPDGLTGGKGVMVSSDHLQTVEDGLAYANELIERGKIFVIEEKLEGEEFSFMAFCDKNGNLNFMSIVRDYKRRDEGDKGENTGGMGSYSDADHRLPFLDEADVETARAIMQKTIDALIRDYPDEPFVGILYGGVMKTAHGIKLIEYNTRFGDPEAMNVLAILESDFVDVCKAMLRGELDKIHVEFRHQATVCKYAVPEGYPDAPIKNQPIDVSFVTDPDAFYFGGVEKKEDGLYTTGGRAVAVLGVGDTITDA